MAAQKSSREIKLRFGVDADNVLFDSWGHALDRLNAARGFKPELRRDETVARPFHLSPAFAARGVTKEEVSLQIDRTWRDFHQELKLMDQNAPVVLTELMKRGISVEIITTMGANDEKIRPNMYLALDRTGIPYDTVSFVKTSEEKVAYPVATIVDDEHKLAIDLAKAGKYGLIYDAPWNREFVTQFKTDPNADRRILLAQNWTETGHQVIKLMEVAQAATIKA